MNGTKDYHHNVPSITHSTIKTAIVRQNETQFILNDKLRILFILLCKQTAQEKQL